MRGGAQGHLVEAADGYCYVLKPRNNPQHRRVLINEWVAGVFLRYLRVAVPETAVLDVTQELLAGTPELSIQRGPLVMPVATGWHFGSRFPGDPGRMAVFDFLPDKSLGSVRNLYDFSGALLFDKWTSNADSRQAIFYRPRFRSLEEPEEFSCRMIDHGFLFQAQEWQFRDADAYGLYHRHRVYDRVTGWNDLEPWMEWILHFPEEAADQALREIPGVWMEDDYDVLVRLLEVLMERRKRVPELIEKLRASTANPFRNWH